MAGRTERLQVPLIPEAHGIASVRGDVIDLGGGRRHPATLADSAEGRPGQEHATERLPAWCAVPPARVPVRALLFALLCVRTAVALGDQRRAGRRGTELHGYFVISVQA